MELKVVLGGLRCWLPIGDWAEEEKIDSESSPRCVSSGSIVGTTLSSLSLLSRTPDCMCTATWRD